jgi:hypothetical protein
MSKANPKRVVQTSSAKPRHESAASRKTSTSFFGNKEELIFNKNNYMWMGIGLASIFIGMLLMMGGAMKDPNVWDPSVIYSTTRTVIAPIFILAGLGIQVYAIFKK